MARKRKDERGSSLGPKAVKCKENREQRRAYANCYQGLRVNGLVVKGRVKEGGRRLSREGDLIPFLLQRRGLSEKGRVSKGLTKPLFFNNYLY